MRYIFEGESHSMKLPKTSLCHYEEKYIYIMIIYEQKAICLTKDVEFPSSFGFALFPNCCEIRIKPNISIKTTSFLQNHFGRRIFH